MVDASVVVEIVLRTAAGVRAQARVFAPNETMHAPHLLDVETLHVLRRLQLHGKVSAARATAAVADIAVLPVQRYGHEPLRDAIWRMRANLSAYDASYVALAAELGAPLLTMDVRIAKAPGHRVRVETP